MCTHAVDNYFVKVKWSTKVGIPICFLSAVCSPRPPSQPNGQGKHPHKWGAGSGSPGSTRAPRHRRSAEGRCQAPSLGYQLQWSSWPIHEHKQTNKQIKHLWNCETQKAKSLRSPRKVPWVRQESAPARPNQSRMRSCLRWRTPSGIYRSCQSPGWSSPKGDQHWAVLHRLPSCTVLITLA